MSICSLVVHTRPEKLPFVSKSLGEMVGVEIHAQDESGKLVVLIDHPDRQVCSQTMMDMANVSGVINTSLIYEYFEESEPTGKEISQ